MNKELYEETQKRLIKPVSVNEAEQLIHSMPQLEILDGRNIENYQQGHIEGAQLIDAFSPDAGSRLLELDKNIPYLVYCTTNVRSTMIVRFMHDQGFKEVYHMVEGMVGWIEHQKDTVSS
ncbi:rhodanese-like domain-containing protein [Halosquirtibacter laminarini]|uniref:Rhodanese-like domain-containing protein n=1 Tax=Halosquirtibacter laminarini TaxID=3374600 RepID=A0AC61NIW1_9BACT|nr:rhodanese-like domain-containing protein [Prolixibacteraceae bacterium]